MKISYNWLKTQFDKLPAPEVLVEKYTFGAFEVEGVERVGDDTIIDLKVLPDRSHYALSWNGLAYEAGAILGMPFKARRYEPILGAGNKVNVKIEDTTLCNRYMARYVANVKVADSPQWLKEELAKIGQRSINSLVDIANYVMFMTGQPLHIFDADKLAGLNIIVRRGKEGEKIDCLDGNSYELNPEMLVIADQENPLVIAGIKGGKTAEVTSETKNIVIESASFNPVSIRKTSAKLKLKSDASKRYENEPSPEMCAYAMEMISTLIKDENKDAVFGEITDEYPNKVSPWQVNFSKTYIESRLGRAITNEEIKKVLEGIQCVVKELRDDTYIVQPPFFRLDLVIEEDFVEEIARILGYDKIQEKLPPKLFPQPTVNPEFFVAEKIKDILKGLGFSETILYTLGEKGDLETLYPVAKDKAYIRKSLAPHLEESIILNTRNADLLGLDIVKIFEIGKTFDTNGEYLKLGIAVGFAKKIKGQKPADVLNLVFANLAGAFNMKFSFEPLEKDLVAVAEVSLDELVRKIEVKDPYAQIDFKAVAKNVFKPYSAYPFATRDVAVFVPAGVSEKEVEDLITSNAGENCIRIGLFDTFVKGEKISYAFRIVFQARDHTLTEEEINIPLNKVYEAMKARGWEIR